MILTYKYIYIYMYICMYVYMYICILVFNPQIRKYWDVIYWDSDAMAGVIQFSKGMTSRRLSQRPNGIMEGGVDDIGVKLTSSATFF